MQPTHHFIQLTDIRVSYYEWGDVNDPVILCVHATGMQGRIWDQTIKHLPAGYRIIALDSRGHGQSHFKGHILDWKILGDDLIQFLKHLNLKNIIGVGHSLGGHMTAQAALALPHMFERIVLIDPVMFEPSRYLIRTDFETGDPADNPMSKRRSAFSNWQEMFERYKERSPYSLWDQEVMKDYCKFGVKAVKSNDGVELCCHPETETSIYMGHHSRDLSSSLDQIKIPVKILRGKVSNLRRGAKIDFLASPTWPDLASSFAQGTDIYLPELTHFIPMQDPELTAKHITEQ
jgi:pimeloyl-ACP methyl ester carboxylesterase